MELGKPSFVSIGAWIALIAIVVYLIYAATHKGDTENYTKGATHTESTYTIAPVQNIYPLAIPGCGRFLTVETPQGLKMIDQDKKVKK
jgi:heme/copper-type cytochrome/quinol oxidase subunit 2